MSAHDQLLSFQIKETVFLTPGRPGIGEIKELELLPDVEIIENEKEISITGCLQLNGEYEAVAVDDETGSLVSAMHFSPFQLDTNMSESPLYGTEKELHHRIPLNITIPRSRISEIGDIYAIVDGFDYEWKSPRELLVVAELKLTGILLEPPGQPQSKEPEWDFVSVNNEANPPHSWAHSLDELEKKLEKLERELSAQETERENTLPQPYLSTHALETERVMEPHHRDANPFQPTELPPVRVPSEGVRLAAERSDVPEDAAASVSAKPETDEQPDAVAASTTPAEERANEAETEAEPVLAEVAAEEGDTVETIATAEAEEAQAQELKVAISGKPAREQSESIQLSTIFAGKAHSAPAAKEAEQPSEDVLAENASGGEQAPSEAVTILSSVVRHEEASFRKVKMCIIQRDETLQEIAERYELSVSRIMEVNHLSSDRIVEGQVLIIPL